jgi:hypothetical protein
MFGSPNFGRGERGGLDHLRDAASHVVRRGDRLRLARGDQHRGSAGLFPVD